MRYGAPSWFALAVLLVIAVFAACTPAASPSAPASASAPAASSPAASASAPADASTSAPASASAPAGEVTLMVGESDLGKIVVDGEGRTLYWFMNDDGGLPTCYDECAATWPALTVDGAVTVGAGLAPDDAQTIDRNDGSKQVTIFGWPLYYYAADAAPGDHQGQGRGDVWFVVSPETAQPIR